MDRRKMLFGMMLLGLATSFSVGTLLAQSMQPLANTALKSDRERDGLRGPVKLAEFDRLGQACYGAKPQQQCIGDRHFTEYDLAGHRLHSLYQNSKWGDNWTYDNAGHLLRLTTQWPDGSKFEESYSYDSSGRVQTILDSHGNETTFTYDDQGLKTSVRSVTPEPDRSYGPSSARPLLAVGGNLFDPAEGGSITTRYNKQDQPWAVEIKDNEGYVLTRIFQDYDTEGRLTSEKEIDEDPGSGFAEKMLAHRPEQERTPEALQQLREQLRAGQKVFNTNTLTTYKYDDQNRLIKKSIETNGFGLQEVETSYNEQGDMSEEKTTYSKTASSLPVGVAFYVNKRGQLVTDQPESEWPEQPPLLEPTTTRYAYQYDTLGNWTEKKTFFPGASEPAVQHRTITYY